MILFRTILSSFQFYTGTSNGMEHLYREDVVMISNGMEHLFE
jgi:hypothetical protein